MRSRVDTCTCFHRTDLYSTGMGMYMGSGVSRNMVMRKTIGIKLFPRHEMEIKENNRKKS